MLDVFPSFRTEYCFFNKQIKLLGWAEFGWMMARSVDTSEVSGFGHGPSIDWSIDWQALLQVAESVQTKILERIDEGRGLSKYM